MEDKTRAIRLKRSETINLEIPAGWFVVVSFTTQAGFRWSVKIADGNNIYFDKMRQSENPNPPEWSSFKTISAGAVIAFDVPETAFIDLRFSKQEVTDNNGNVVGKTYTFIGEDGCDTDYNDVFVTVAAWKSAG